MSGTGYREWNKFQTVFLLLCKTTSTFLVVELSSSAFAIVVLINVTKEGPVQTKTLLYFDAVLYTSEKTGIYSTLYLLLIDPVFAPRDGVVGL